MSEIPESERFSLSYQEVRGSAATSSLISPFLTYLVFEGSGVRIGLELTLCVFGYVFLHALAPWGMLGFGVEWHSLFSWFVTCSTIAIIDRTILCRPLHQFRRAREQDLRGNYKTALKLLDEISPDKRSLVPCPQHLYHLNRAQILIHAREFEKAEEELQLAEKNDAQLSQLMLARVALNKAQGRFDEAADAVSQAKELFGSALRFKIEEAILEYDAAIAEDRKKLWEVRDTLHHLLFDNTELLIHGDTYAPIALGYYGCTLLWTGKADEGMEKLSHAIASMKGLAFYNPNMRPTLSSLLLERAYYLATHRSPDAAVKDLGTALAQCSYPWHLERAQEVKEELLFRFGIKQ